MSMAKSISFGHQSHNGELYQIISFVNATEESSLGFSIYSYAESFAGVDTYPYIVIVTLI